MLNLVEREKMCNFAGEIFELLTKMTKYNRPSGHQQRHDVVNCLQKKNKYNLPVDGYLIM